MFWVCQIGGRLFCFILFLCIILCILNGEKIQWATTRIFCPCFKRLLRRYGKDKFSSRQTSRLLLLIIMISRHWEGYLCSTEQSRIRHLPRLQNDCKTCRKKCLSLLHIYRSFLSSLNLFMAVPLARKNITYQGQHRVQCSHLELKMHRCDTPVHRDWYFGALFSGLKVHWCTSSGAPHRCPSSPHCTSAPHQCTRPPHQCPSSPHRCTSAPQRCTSKCSAPKKSYLVFAPWVFQSSRSTWENWLRKYVNRLRGRNKTKETEMQDSMKRTKIKF